MPIVNVPTEHQRDRSTWTLTMLEDDQGFGYRATDEVDNVAGLQVLSLIHI